MNQFLGMLVLLPIQKILNSLVNHDPYVGAQLRKFDGKTLEIISRSPGFTLCVMFDEGNIKLSAIDSASLMLEPDATISGKAEDLLGLLLSKAEQRALANSAISIAGDALLVQEIYKLLGNLDLDWEDYLSPLLGDIASNEAGKLGREAKSWSQTASSKLQRSVHDYLVEETRAVPGREEFEHFSEDLDQLRFKIDRATARAEQLNVGLERLEKQP